MPPYYLGTSLAYLFDFNLDYVIDDLKNMEPDKVNREIKEVLKGLDFKWTLSKVLPKIKYLGEYGVEETKREVFETAEQLLKSPFPISYVLNPISFTIQKWLNQYNLSIQIDRLRSQYDDGVVFAATSFCFDPSYQLNKHKIYYLSLKWYNRVFHKPKHEDMGWYTTQRTFERWTEIKRWYEAS
ncbi:MAG: hypothetical protein QXR45_08780 [Candidatus Bathyarchaeia archaeon]